MEDKANIPQIVCDSGCLLDTLNKEKKSSSSCTKKENWCIEDKNIPQIVCDSLFIQVSCISFQPLPRHCWQFAQIPMIGKASMLSFKVFKF